MSEFDSLPRDHPARIDMGGTGNPDDYLTVRVHFLSDTGERASAVATGLTTDEAINRAELEVFEDRPNHRWTYNDWEPA